MLVSLHVKNLAIIEEEEIEFGEGLNILSGETGAGKSIILGALGLCMGKKPIKGIVRDTGEEAFVEAVFSVNDRQKALINALDMEVYDGEIILQRKITPQRASAKINGESVPAGKLSEISEILIDIYGQHEQQTLLSPKNHIKLLDEYAGEELTIVLKELSEEYKGLKALKKEYEESDVEEGARLREQELLKHEINEIESAKLIPGEDETLLEEYKILSKSEKITEALEESEGLIKDSVSDNLARAIRALKTGEEIDGRISPMIDALSDAENIISEALRDIVSFGEEIRLNPMRLDEVSKRLDLIDSLKRRFSGAGVNGSIEEVLNTYEENCAKLEKLNDYEEYRNRLLSNINEVEGRYLKLCKKATEIRKDVAERLSGLITNALEDLNFNGEGLEIEVRPLDTPGPLGQDDIVFMISTNPGEAKRPINEIASGGELSRIMLAIKTIFAETGEIDTLVFDEIDSGVSGRTAARVALRLSTLSMGSQVICITHLPQIAAKASTHFLIEKNSSETSTVSSIRKLSKDERITEVARMVAGDSITQAAIENARILIEGEHET